MIGYLHIVVEKIKTDTTPEPIKCKIALSQDSFIQTPARASSQIRSQAYMFEVLKDNTRLISECFCGQQKIGQCRYDLIPFFNHHGVTHIIQSELYDQDNLSKGQIKFKVTYYSTQFGKLKLRIFHLDFVEPFVQKFKEARVRVRLGSHSQSTRLKSLSQQWDEDIEVVVLQPSWNLSFDVIHSQGTLASYTIPNVKKANLLIDQTKAYHVSLFNNDKAVGSIKYQVQWIK